MSSRHGSFHHRARGAMVGEKFARGERLITRLIMHVLAASGERQAPERPRRKEELAAHFIFRHHFSTSAISSGLSVARNALVLAISNVGSEASMQRKNRSMDARLNISTLKTG